MPKVSIVIPTYNSETLLEATIQSILTQDYEDFELLIVDDGSTDNTAEVIRELQIHDARIRYLVLPQNRGIGFARDVGLRHTSGTFLALADADDHWMPGKLSMQVQFMEEQPEVDIAFGDFLNIDYIEGTEQSGFSETSAGLAYLKTHPLRDNWWVIESGADIGILYANFIATPTMVIRRTILDQIGGFNITLRRTPDFEFCWRSANLGARLAYCSNVLIKRYRYSSGITAASAVTNIEKLDALEICRWISRNNNTDSPNLLRHLRNAESRTYRKLIRIYGRERDRRRAWMFYRRSVIRCGFSLRQLAFFVLAFLGPSVLLGAQKLKVGLTLKN